MTSRHLFFTILLLASLLIPTTASALSPFPGEAPVTVSGSNTSYTLDNIYSVQETVIPLTLWAFILLIGLAFLTISILIPDRGELITGLLGLAFITLAWVQSAFLGTTEFIASELPNNIIAIQPITTIYASHWLPWLLTIVFLVAFGNVILAIGNMLRRPTEPYPRPDVME